MIRDDIFEQRWDTVADLFEFRRKELGLTQMEIECRTVDLGPIKVSRASYSRVAGKYWIPKNPDVLIAISRALQLDEQSVLELAEQLRKNPQVLSQDYGHVFQLMQAMVFEMNNNEQTLTIRTLDHKVALFKEPIHQLARNFVDLWKGELGIDEIPRNGLRPIRHYLRPFCSEDFENWHKAVAYHTEKEEPAGPTPGGQ